MAVTTAEIQTCRVPRGLFVALREAAGAEAPSLLREAGQRSGAPLLAALADHAGGEDELYALPADRFWNELADFFADLGWGSATYEEAHPGIGLLSARDWVESVDGGASVPSCHFTTGLLSDLLGRVADVDLAVLEVECRSRGDDACRFLIGSEASLTEVHRQIAAGADFRAAVRNLG